MANANVSNGDDGESGRLAQDAKAVAHIAYEGLDEIAARRFVALLFEALISAELDARATFSFRARQTGALEIISPMLDMGAKLLVHLGVHLGTLKKIGDAKTKRIEEFHTSSGCAPSAEPMAATSRFQLAVSSCRRLRPAAVSS